MLAWISRYLRIPLLKFRRKPSRMIYNYYLPLRIYVISVKVRCGPEEVSSRKCKLGEACLLATGFRPDICALLAVFAGKVTHLRGYDVCRTDDLIYSAEQRQARVTLRRSSELDIYQMWSVRWWDTAYEAQSENVKCRLEYMFGLLPMSLWGPRRLLHWSSRFTRRTAKGGLGGERYAFSETAGQM